MAQRTLELLESLITGHKMTPGELDGLLADQVAEDLYLEYKHGNELRKRKPQPCRTIREYMSAFANSAGGVLIVGVDEAHWAVTGCKAPGGGNLAEWASTCLTPIAPYFSPPPNLQIVVHTQGEVLVAAVGRSLNLVPCVVQGGPVFFLRIHQQTIDAPEYLINDLVLGKRQHPYLRIAEAELKSLERRDSSREDGTTNLDFGFGFVVENDSLSWAEDVRLDVVGWSKRPYSQLSNHLLSHVEVKAVAIREPPDAYNLLDSPTHKTPPKTSVEPFEVSRFRSRASFTVPLTVRQGEWCTPYTWKGAAYLMSRNSPSAWYQLSLPIDERLLDQKTDLLAKSELLKAERASGVRPVVAWEGIKPIAK